MTDLQNVKKVTDLVIYQLAEEIVLDLERLCQKPSLRRKFIFTDHLIKSAVSIVANIAEGFGRYYYRENKNFLYYARGSLEETKCRLRHLTLAKYFEKDAVKEVFAKLELLGIKINNTISLINRKLQQVTTSNN